LKRAVISIPSNIAEGAARNGKKEFKQFLYIALGSLSEVETQVLIAKRLNYLNECDTILKKIWNLKKMIKKFTLKVED
jgi:four helix bundle protein